jgi:hypothetical protein
MKLLIHHRQKSIIPRTECISVKEGLIYESVKRNMEVNFTAPF